MTEAHPQDRIIGYARVSTYGQTLDAQLEQLKTAGCVMVYREKATGAQVERRELQRMLKAMAPGDVVTVTRIDRLSPLDVRPVFHRQGHHRRRRAIPVVGGTVG